MQYFLFIFGFFTAISTYRILKFLKNTPARLAILGLIITLSVPTVVGNLVEFYGLGRTALSKITISELEALKYLKRNSDEKSVILTAPFNQNLKDKFTSQPWPIYGWYDTPYISALSSRSSYLASEHVRLLFYPQTDERLENKRKFFEQSDFGWNRQFLKQVKISYIYLAKGEIQKSLDLEKNSLSVFYENDEVIIYQVI